MTRQVPFAETLGYGAYAALGALLALPGSLVVGAGALASKRWRSGLSERIGARPETLAAARAKSPRVWVHAASIGEVRAAVPLLSMLKERRPEVGIHLTTTTPEGNRTARALDLADSVGMLPVDLPGVPARLLEAFAPDALVLLETELWPGLLRAARRRLVPVLVVNGRISDRSFRRYAAVRPLLRPVLDDVAAFSMQAEVDRQRILALGADPARVELHGNLKYDALSLPQPAPPAVLAGLARETVWIAGSTHEGEETAVADAFLALRREIPGLRLVVAPRHLKRAEDAFRALSGRGLAVVRRSELEGPPPDDAVVLLDTSGELAAIYAIATAVFVGGSLVPKGGHNPLEPLAHGRPVAFGPYTENFRDVSAVALGSGGAVRVPDAALLADGVRAWLADPAAARDAGIRARAHILAKHGAAARVFALLERWIGPGDGMVPAEAESWLGLEDRPLLEAAAGIVSEGYRAAVTVRKALWDAETFPVHRARVPVVALGNVVVGGTGKSPATIALARRLVVRGRRVAIVSRGYGGRPGASPRVVSEGGWNAARSHAPSLASGLALPSAALVGDEPRMMASRVPEAAVVVHPDRVAAVRQAEELGADVVLLDDGLQHRRLHRDAEIVLLDARAPFGNGRFLPAGPLRDTPARMAKADLVLLTRCDLAGPGATARAAARVSLATGAPIARFAHRIARFDRWEGGCAAPDSGSLATARPFAFCGIAQPASFVAALAATGVRPVGVHAYPDHAPFDPEDVRALEEEARAAGANALLTTEKDAVRLPSCVLPVYVAVLEFEPLAPHDEGLLDRLLSRIVAS